MMTTQMNMGNPNVIGSGGITYFNEPRNLGRPNTNIDNILFVADLPDEACEEDLANFFKPYNFSIAKVIR